MKHNLFVYGTLMKGHHNHGFLKGGTLLGSATIQGYSMLHLGGFPGLVPSNDDSRVSGELYSITDDMLPALDRLEGVPTLYERHEVVGMREGKQETFFLYIFQPTRPLSDYKVIETGVWSPSS